MTVRLISTYYEGRVFCTSRCSSRYHLVMGMLHLFSNPSILRVWIYFRNALLPCSSVLMLLIHWAATVLNLLSDGNTVMRHHRQFILWVSMQSSPREVSCSPAETSWGVCHTFALTTFFSCGKVHTVYHVQLGSFFLWINLAEWFPHDWRKFKVLSQAAKLPFLGPWPNEWSLPAPYPLYLAQGIKHQAVS